MHFAAHGNCLLAGLQDSFQQRRGRSQLPARDRMDRRNDRGVYGSVNAELPERCLRRIR